MKGKLMYMVRFLSGCWLITYVDICIYKTFSHVLVFSGLAFLKAPVSF